MYVIRVQNGKYSHLCMYRTHIDGSSHYMILIIKKNTSILRVPCSLYAIEVVIIVMYIMHRWDIFCAAAWIAVCATHNMDMFHEKKGDMKCNEGVKL